MDARAQLYEFISHGREVMREATVDRYGADSIRIPAAPPACRLPQPGFVGRAYSGIVILNPHPGEGDRASREPMHRRWDAVLQRWLDEGNRASYDNVFTLWDEDRDSWGAVWTRWLEPLLAEAGLDIEEVAFLNLIKHQLPSQTSEAVQRRMARVDWRFTSAQLEILRPTAVLAGGKLVGRILSELQPTPQFEVRVQNRARARRGVSAEARRVLEDGERRELASWLRAATVDRTQRKGPDAPAEDGISEHTRTLEDLVRSAIQDAGRLAKSMEGGDFLAQAHAEFGTNFDPRFAWTQQGFESARVYRLKVPDPSRSAWMDNTTLFAAMRLLDSAVGGDGDGLNALTMWDLAEFVRTVVSADRIYHHQHQAIDDERVNKLLGEEVLVSLPIPHDHNVLARNGVTGITFAFWEQALGRIALMRNAPEGTLARQELMATKQAWQSILGSGFSIDDFTDLDHIQNDWRSPVDTLSEWMKHLFTAEDPMEGAWRVAGALTDVHVRSYVNQSYAELLRIPYARSLSRAPFAPHLEARAVRVGAQIAGLTQLEDWYRGHTANAEVQIPLFLAVLIGMRGRDDLWKRLQSLREDAAGYRRARTKLEQRIRDGHVRTSEELQATVATLPTPRLARGARLLASVAVDVVPAVALQSLTELSLAVTGAAALGAGLITGDLGLRLKERIGRPHLVWMRGIAREARGLEALLPQVSEMWRVTEPDQQVLKASLRRIQKSRALNG